MEHMQQDEAGKLAACPDSVTRGMLSRWYYKEEPGRGFSRETLTEHLKECTACIDELEIITQEDEILQERFKKAQAANAVLAGAVISQDTALATVERNVSDALSQDDDELADDSIQQINVLKTVSNKEKALGLVKSLRSRLSDTNIDRKAQRVRDLSSFAKGILDLKSEDFDYAMKESLKDIAEYPAEKALPLIVHLLGDPEPHLSSSQPIVSLKGEDLIVVNWLIWKGSPVA